MIPMTESGRAVVKSQGHLGHAGSTERLLARLSGWVVTRPATNLVTRLANKVANTHLSGWFVTRPATNLVTRLANKAANTHLSGWFVTRAVTNLVPSTADDGDF